MYLFFMRHFNDIDHMTPIVWRMHTQRLPVTVLVMNPDYAITKDYRLRFLSREGVKVKSLYDIGRLNNNPGALFQRKIFKSYYALNQFFEHFNPSAAIIPVLQKYFKKIAKNSYKECCRRYFTAHWAQSILQQTGARTLCFDWVAPWRFVVDKLMDAAHDMNLPVLSVPHGVFIYTNDEVKIGSKDKERNYRKFCRYDEIIVQNPLFRDVIAHSGITTQKLHILGSARYCPEWVKQNKAILPRSLQATDPASSKLKVVFMTTRPTYRVDVERMIRTFDLLSSIEGIDVVVKPHTRSGEEAKIYENLNLSNVSDTSSVELCEWADIMIVIGSSILIETLLQGKPVLYLKYLHENITLYEEMDACWTINDEMELREALRILVANPKFTPYAPENAEKFLNEIIYGSQEKRDVLGDYVEFIVESWVKQRNEIE
jgi:hypothetical protein